MTNRTQKSTAKAKKKKALDNAKLAPDATEPRSQRASFMRRFFAMIYDTLVAVAVGMCAAIVMSITLVILLKNGVLDLQGYLEPSDLIQASFGYKLLIQVWVAIWVTGFFLWFWKHGGQTIGMRAWRLRMYAMDEKPVGYGRLLLRMLTALMGIGTLLVLLDYKNKLALQDRASNIEMLKLLPEDNDHKSW